MTSDEYTHETEIQLCEIKPYKGHINKEKEALQKDTLEPQSIDEKLPLPRTSKRKENLLSYKIDTLIHCLEKSGSRKNLQCGYRMFLLGTKIASL